MEFCTQEVPRYYPLSISGYHIREAGSTAVQELAFTIASGFAHIELGLRRGLDIDSFAPGLSFFFNSHVDFFEEIAKFRAARRIWARWLKERYGAKTERSLMLKFHTQTAGVSLTAQQPYNNVVRTATEALAERRLCSRLPLKGPAARAVAPAERPCRVTATAAQVAGSAAAP